jgi:thiol-disulfide isomerase/thioredoxin
MIRILSVMAGIFLLVNSALAQEPARPAASILEDAYQQAAKEKKNVFVLFHASWCGWCHKMDTAMNDPRISRFFRDNYVITHLVVFESVGKEKRENPGALDLLKKYKAEEMGIPYWQILDKKGKLLADSQQRPDGAGLEIPGENTGCPASEKEVSYFISVLQKTSPLKPEQLEKIRERFRQNESR